MKQKALVLEQAWLDHQNQLLNFIRSRVDSLADAEDILNDVFVKLAQQTASKTVPDNIASWLYRVTKNSIVDFYRSRRKFDQLPEDIADDAGDATALEQLSRCMLPMIQSLPDLYQQPLMLSEIERLKNDEVALQLGLNLPTVKSRILRGRAKLHRSLGRCCAIHQNSAGHIVDFDQKASADCVECGQVK